MSEYVIKESGEVLRMIRRGEGSKDDIQGKLRTTGLDIYGGGYDGDLTIFVNSEITCSRLEFMNFVVNGNLDLTGLEVCNGPLLLNDLKVVGGLLLPRGMLDNILIKGLHVTGIISWV